MLTVSKMEHYGTCGIRVIEEPFNGPLYLVTSIIDINDISNCKVFVTKDAAVKYIKSQYHRDCENLYLLTTTIKRVEKTNIQINFEEI